MNQPQSFGILGPDEFRKIREVFESAIELAPAERARFIDQGAEPVGNTPEQYTAFIEREIAKWAKVIKATGIKAN